MNVEQQTHEYLATLPQAKRTEMIALSNFILDISPDAKRWFDHGKDNDGKVVSNPSIGYGTYNRAYSNGTTRGYYRIGISANTSGLSVYILGIADKAYLANTYAKDLGKATVTGYCIKFKKLSDIDLDVLKAAIQYGFGLDE